MATPTGAQSPFDSFRQPLDPAAQAKHDEDTRKRMLDQHTKAQQRLGELISSNATLPTTLSSVTILNANRTRRSFLSRIFSPLLAKDNEEPYTLDETLRHFSKGVDKLNRLDIFEAPISVYFDRPDPIHPTTTPSDISAFLSVREKPRLFAQSGAWAGSNDGSIQGSLLFRNIFGGAESFTASASRGTRTRSAYSATFDTPVLSNPDFRWELTALASATQKPWASHEELLRGGDTRVRWASAGGHRHELAYGATWRQVTALAEKASPTVRSDAGDSFKSAISHVWSWDRRNNPLLPTNGFLLKSVTEVAGQGPLESDVAFGKLQLESQAALPLVGGASFTAGLRGGLMVPLAVRGTNTLAPVRVNDRFTLGGPTDVRGFRIAGLGPRDGQDAVGGDLYAAGGASLLLPFPRIGADVPLRLQLFVNGGRLLGLQDTRADKSAPLTSTDVQDSLRAAVAELGNGLPSMAAGVGVVYAMPIARFELNFSLPLAVRQGEEARKGLSVGVGMSFL